MVLLVVDTQRLITSPKLYQFELFEKNIEELIKQARSSKIEVIYIRHDDGGEDGLT